MVKDKKDAMDNAYSTNEGARRNAKRLLMREPRGKRQRKITKCR
jgi:hypothetical protein